MFLKGFECDIWYCLFDDAERNLCLMAVCSRAFRKSNEGMTDHGSDLRNSEGYMDLMH